MTSSDTVTPYRSSKVAIIAFALSCIALGAGLSALFLPYGRNPQTIAALEKQQADVTRVALALAANQLHAVVLSGAPYAHEMELVTILGRNDPSIMQPLAALAAGQKSGIPSIRRIVSDFEQIAARVLIDESTQSDSGWWGQALGRISALSNALMMEAKLNPFNSQVAPTIKDMQIAIAAGDFAQSVQLIALLPEPAQASFAPWKDLVKLRTDAMIAVEKVAQRAANVVGH